MRKLLTLLCILLVHSGFTQKKETLNVFYGTQNKMGFNLVITQNSNIVWGFGLSFDLLKKNIGSQMLKDQYDLVSSTLIVEEDKLLDAGSLYFLGGYNFNKTAVGAKIGLGLSKKYLYFQPNSIGDYVILKGRNDLMVGVFINHSLTKIFNTFLSYDTFNGCGLGVGITF